MEGEQTRNVLMILYDHPPLYNAGAERGAKFARYLPSFGWRPLIITTNAYGDEASDRTSRSAVHRTPEISSLFGRRRSKTKSDETSALREKSILHGAVTWVYARLLVPDPQIIWSMIAFIPTLRLIRKNRPEVLFSTSPPASSHLLAMSLKSVTRTPWVMDLRDPWSFESVNPRTEKPGLRRFLETRMERMCMRRADMVIANTPETAERYRRMYPDLASKITVITNGFDREEIDMARAWSQGASANEFAPKGAFILSHVGRFTRTAKNDPVPASLLKALSSLRREGRVSPENFRLVLAGDISQRARDMIMDAGIADVVSMPGRLTHMVTQRLLLASDLLLVNDDAPDGATYVRSKLYEYIGSGRPVLGILRKGSTSRLLNESGCGKVVSPADIVGLQQLLLNALSGQSLRNRDTAFDAGKYERRRLAGELASLLDRISLKGGMDDA